jgi:hypothetical protein
MGGIAVSINSLSTTIKAGWFNIIRLFCGFSDSHTVAVFTHNDKRYDMETIENTRKTSPLPIW